MSNRFKENLFFTIFLIACFALVYTVHLAVNS